jgi:hypothetical protein
MREECALWRWLPRSRFCVFPQPGLAASAVARPRPAPLKRRRRILPPPGLNPHGLNPSGRSLTDPKTSPASTGNPLRAARKGTGCSVRDMGIRRSMRALLIRIGPIRVKAIRAPLFQGMCAQPFQGMRPLHMLLRDIWATGLISTAIYPSRTRIGYCEATPASGALTRQISSG